MADEIIKVINELCTKFGIVVDWSAENILPYAEILFQKFVNMMMWQDIFFIVIGVIGGTLLLLVFVNLCKNCNDSVDDAECFLFTMMFLSFIGCVIFTCVKVYGLIQVLTFPEFVFWNYINK